MSKIKKPLLIALLIAGLIGFTTLITPDLFREMILKWQTTQYLASIPNIKVLSIGSFYTNVHPQTFAEIEVLNKGKVKFNSLWPPNNGWNSETNTSVSQIGPCTFSVVDADSRSRGFRDWVTLWEIKGSEVKTINDLILKYDEIIESVSKWPKSPKSPLSNSVKAGHYASCSSKAK